MTRNFGIPVSTLLHTFGLYKAIVIAPDGTRVLWSNILGFSIATDADQWPIVDISDLRDIEAAIEGFVFLEKSWTKKCSIGCN